MRVRSLQLQWKSRVDPDWGVPCHLCRNPVKAAFFTIGRYTICLHCYETVTGVKIA